MSEETPNTPATTGGKPISISPALRNVLLAVALLVVTFAVYWPSLHGGFTWDDDRYVTNLPVLQEPGGLLKIWTDYAAIPDYYPLTFTVLWVEYQFFADHPTGYHIVNTALHAFAGIAAWRLLRRLGLKSAWIAAFVFAVHPVHVESVAWVTEIKNVLGILFFFLAAERYLKFAGIGPEFESLVPVSPRWGDYAAGLALFLCALLSKSASCTLPVILALLVWLKKPADLKRHLINLIPWILLAAALAGMTAFVEHRHEHVRADLLQMSLPQRAAIAGRAVMFYLGKIIWPDPILIIYPRWNSAAILEQIPFAAALLALLAALWALRKKIGRAPLAALLIYIVALGPTLGFINYFTMWYSFVFDHYQYFGTLAVIALLCELGWLGVAWIKARAPADRQDFIRLLSSLTVAVVILVLGILTSGYAALWGSPESLWRFTVDHNPRAFIALHNLANHLTERKNTEHTEPLSVRYLEPIELLKRAMEVEPRDHRPYMLIAQLYNWAGDYPTAMAYYRKSRSMMPAYVQARNQGYQVKGDNAQNATIIDDAKNETPLEDFTQPYQAGLTLEDGGDPAGAIQRYQDALALNPRNVSALVGMGRCYLALSDTSNAIATLQRATELKPAHKAAWTELAKAYRVAGKFHEAANAQLKAQ